MNFFKTILLNFQEQQNEILERELETAKSELNVNTKRLEAFQMALNEINNDDEDDDDDMDDDDDDEENEEVVTTESDEEVNGSGGGSGGLGNEDEDDVNVELVEADPEIDAVDHKTVAAASKDMLAKMNRSNKLLA